MTYAIREGETTVARVLLQPILDKWLNVSLLLYCIRFWDFYYHIYPYDVRMFLKILF